MIENGAVIHLAVPILVGIALGIIEAYFVYEDENMTSGRSFLGDIWHGLFFAIIGVVVATNIPVLLTYLPKDYYSYFLMNGDGVSLSVSILITIFMLFKMVASHAIKGVSGGGFSEKIWHKLVVSIAVGFSPYYIFLLYNVPFVVNIAKMIPWLPL